MRFQKCTETKHQQVLYIAVERGSQLVCRKFKYSTKVCHGTYEQFILVSKSINQYFY